MGSCQMANEAARPQAFSSTESGTGGDSEGVGEPARSQPVTREPTADFATVYEDLFSFVWRTARRMGVADSALDDVCQDVFVVVHRRLPEFRGQSTLKTWVFGILMNVVQVHRRTVQRKSPRHASRETGIDPDSLADERYKQPDQRAASAEAARVAHELLAELADDQRAVFILAEIEEMPVTEVAHAVGANLNTVYARLRAARKNFALAARRYRAKDRWRLR